jgi:hypothetical protein
MMQLSWNHANKEVQQNITAGRIEARGAENRELSRIGHQLLSGSIDEETQAPVQS